MSDRNTLSTFAAVVLALGLLFAGWNIGQGLVKIKTQDRYVTVKGSAERIVDADLLVWPLPHTVGGNDLAGVQRALSTNTTAIRQFFLDAGFKPEEIVVSPPRLEDRWAYAYGENRAPERFRYSNTVILRTGDVAKALQAMRNSGQLVAGGVMLDQGAVPEFDYTKLNDIKPALIAEATANARDSAEQFAKDSDSKLGGIRSANQGVVTINDRDQGSPQVKKVRVVTTVEYFLRD